jgi:hypothetical protein
MEPASEAFSSVTGSPIYLHPVGLTCRRPEILGPAHNKTARLSYVVALGDTPVTLADLFQSSAAMMFLRGNQHPFLHERLIGQMTSVGREPSQLAPVEPESSP